MMIDHRSFSRTLKNAAFRCAKSAKKIKLILHFKIRENPRLSFTFLKCKFSNYGRGRVCGWSSIWCRRERRLRAGSSGRGSGWCASAGTWCSWDRCGSASCRLDTGRTWGLAVRSGWRTCGWRVRQRTGPCCGTPSGGLYAGPTPLRPGTGRRCTHPPTDDVTTATDRSSDLNNKTFSKTKFKTFHGALSFYLVCSKSPLYRGLNLGTLSIHITIFLHVGRLDFPPGSTDAVAGHVSWALFKITCSNSNIPSGIVGFKKVYKAGSCKFSTDTADFLQGAQNFNLPLTFPKM